VYKDSGLYSIYPVSILPLSTNSKKIIL